MQPVLPPTPMLFFGPTQANTRVRAARLLALLLTAFVLLVGPQHHHGANAAPIAHGDAHGDAHAAAAVLDAAAAVSEETPSCALCVWLAEQYHPASAGTSAPAPAVVSLPVPVALRTHGTYRRAAALTGLASRAPPFVTLPLS